MFRNVVVGISGGVDSGVSAYLLKEKGFKVLGIFMKNWDEYDETGRCSGEQDLLDAEYTCDKLDDYQNGLTPNPDILCNRHIKFDLFYKHALENLKYDAIATGHYAKTNFGSYLENYEEEKAAELRIPKDAFKDQTFFLAAVKRDALRKIMFPLSDLYKIETKEIAKKCGLNRLTQKRESTGICFVGRRDFKEFIKEYIIPKPGNFIDTDTQQIVGQHDGIHLWTIGQRCRLSSHLNPYYVAQKDIFTNTIYVASGHDHPKLFSDVIFANHVNWLCPDPLIKPNSVLKCRFRFQHTKPLVKCLIYRNFDMSDDEVEVLLDKPLRAITPGQYAVFYNDTNCLGCARIVKSSMMDNRDNVICLEEKAKNNF